MIVTVRDPDNLTLVRVTEFQLPCAAFIRSSKLGAIQLNDGKAFAESSISGRYETRDARPFEDTYDERTLGERALPKVAGKTLLSSHRVNSRGEGKGGDFVGIWQVGPEWLVQSFSQHEDRSFTKPHLLMRSSLPLRAVTYFPAPDTPSGTLEILQEQPDGKIRSLTFGWWHRSAYEQP